MAKVLFKRIEDSSMIDSYPIVDGSVFVTKDGKMFIDYDNTRASVGGTPDSQMSDRSTNSVQNCVVKQYIDNSINNITDEYSTNEVKTRKTWINGKPIYRKVIVSTTNTASMSIAHGISDLGYTTNVFAFASLGTGDTYIANNNSAYTLAVGKISSTTIDITQNGFNDWNIIIVLEYTKTTD